jgi:hypothetical protein
MGQDLATLAPTAVVAVAFVIGVWLLLRRELAPKRRSQADASSGEGTPPPETERKSLYFAAWRIMICRNDAKRAMREMPSRDVVSLPAASVAG